MVMHKNDTLDIDHELYVVGVGASAGGLDAITKLLASFNGIKSDFCVVVVMHLSPNYKNELTAILNKRCNWPVITVKSNLKMEARNIYVAPQNADIHIEGTDLMLDTLPEKYSTAPSIDSFFTSLAKARRNRAVGIILSGYGYDGSKGIMEIKKNSGFTMAQFPDTAEQDDMPKAAINTQMVDVIVPPEQIFEEITQFINNSKAKAASPPQDKSIDALFELLEKRLGTNFSLYKPATIMRRINHRMANLQIASLIEYYETIRNSPRELDLLFESVLIGVTEFFRDTKAFESYKSKLAHIVRNKALGDTIRIWCVGCASGEEAFSVAILLHEILGDKIKHLQVQIFASDIDERALNVGRKGVFARRALENLGEELLRNYFDERSGHQFEVKKRIKKHILFTRHDISKDPPFVELDSIVCRNLLIYFNDDFQKQAFQIFHYSLKTHGILFLGKSESISMAADLFESAHADKIYYKTDAAFNYQLHFSRLRGKSELEKAEMKKSEVRNRSIVEVAKETLYHKYDDPFVVINERGEIKQVQGSLHLYLEISVGNMNASIFKLAKKELVTVLKAVQAKVKKTKVGQSSHIVKFELYGNAHHVKIKIIPFIYTVGNAQYYLVIFKEVTPEEQVFERERKLDTANFVDLKIKELEDELATKSEHLQIFTEELEVTNEELPPLNQELQLAYEELKSINHDLETSNKELQSAIEELNTANHKMRLANEALIQKERELLEEKDISQKNELRYRTIAENIPNGTVGVLNDQLEIEYIGGEGSKVLLPEDLLGEVLPSKNSSQEQARKVREVFEASLNGKPGFIEVEYHNRYYKILTVPLSLSFDQEKRILYLTQEITEAKINQLKLETVLKAAKQVVFEYDFQKAIVPKNISFSALLETEEVRDFTKKEVLAKIHPDDLKVAKIKFPKALKTGSVDYELRLITDKGTKFIRIIAEILFDVHQNPENAIVTVLDISDDKELLYQVKESEERFKVIADSAPITIWITDKHDKCTYINQTFLEYTGSNLEDNLNDGWLEYIHPEDQRRALISFMKASREKRPFELEYRVKNKDKTYGWFLNKAHPILDKEGKFAGFVGTNVDITEQKEFTKYLKGQIAQRTAELEKSNKKLKKLNNNLVDYAHITSHDLQEPVRKIRTFNSMLKDKIIGNDSAERLVDKIENSANRMTNLIKDILEYSKVSEDNTEFAKVDLNAKLKKIEQDLELLISEKNATIIAQDLGSIKTMSTQIYQLFSNLIKNGIKFNANRPIIKILAEDVKGSTLTGIFESSANVTYKKIQFIDNGIGIDEHQKTKIFKPFSRLHSKSQYSGTGIGLALCKRIIDLHHGHITVTKNEKEGANFTVYLPINQTRKVKEK